MWQTCVPCVEIIHSFFLHETQELRMYTGQLIVNFSSELFLLKALVRLTSLNFLALIQDKTNQVLCEHQ